MKCDQREKEILARIESDLRHVFAPSTKDKQVRFGGVWESQIEDLSKTFIHEDFSVDAQVLRKFQHLQVFFSDMPTDRLFLKKILRGENALQFKRDLIELVGLFELAKQTRFQDTGILDLLKQYPCNRVGDPNVFIYEGYQYTRRWIIRIWHLLLFKHYLQPRLETDFCLLDVGSNYGVFNYLIKKEFPKSSQILVDFPQTLALAHYYLGISFPKARIASYKELAKLDVIDRNFIKDFDFILLPTFLYKKIAPQTLDVFCSISSLWEMSRGWFEYYINAEPFSSVKYFFCMSNQVKSVYFDKELTILDYHLREFKKLYFQIAPSFLPPKEPETPYFEYIGQRIGV